jgi:predicted HAD superfamily Cof-like phosphohydrolase
MEKIDALNQVAKFHKTFKHPILDSPQIPSAKRAELRISLLQEELNELKEAIEANDLVEVADALCDIQYVLSGAVLEFGMGEKFVTLFNEVQRSNMSKACSTLEEAEHTVAHYKSTKGVSAHIEEDNGLFLVYRDEDKKTLKSVAYSPADLKGIL